MGDLSRYFGIIIAIYLIRGGVIFANFWMVFEVFRDHPKREWNNKDRLWLCFYAVITILYRFAVNSGERILFVVIGGLFFVRIVPFLWNRYGWKLSLLIEVLFYECVVDCISQNIEFLFINKINLVGYRDIDTDVFEMITEVIVCSFLIILMLLRRSNILKVCFTVLSIWEYILLFLVLSAYGVLQLEIYSDLSAGNLIKKISVITFALLIMLIAHVIMIRDQNISMNNMIGNLKEPMKQITASYIEMEEKNTELRRFRHDTMNLLVVLRLLIEKKNPEQAIEYIDKIHKTLDVIQLKAFDTGNYIADALLESKAKLAKQNNITMTLEGNIPANRVEDVNLVILISNLLDNAIEAAKQVDGERKIEIQSILKKNIWILSVKNSCVKDVVIRENRVETTKEDREAHGFGITNVERVTKKYGGNLLLSCENQVFTARAMLMLTT